FRGGAKKLERVSLEALLEGVLGSFDARAAAAGISVHREVRGAIPPLTVDPLQIEVVLRNLLANAFDAVAAMPPGERRVTVELGRDRSAHVHVRVLDSGRGIAPEEAGQLFEAFSSTKATGMGVGLALSRAVVEAHGGRLWAVPGE